MSQDSARSLLGLIDKLDALSESITDTLTVEDLDEVRELWVDILRIKNDLFDCEDFSDIQFVVNSGNGDDAKTYHGLMDKSSDKITEGEFGIYSRSVCEKIIKSMGDLSMVRNTIADVNDIENVTDSGSSSIKLLLFNKISLLLDEFPKVVSEISTKNDLINRVYDLYFNDLYYRQKETSPDPISSDEHFNRRYMLGFTYLLANIQSSDTRKIQEEKIMDAATAMINKYLFDSKIVLLYDIHSIHEFHQRLWQLLKSCFSDNDDITNSIDNYTVLNPIFPILKPLINQLLNEESARYIEDEPTVTNTEPQIETNDEEIHADVVIPVGKMSDLIVSLANVQPSNIPSLRRIGPFIREYGGLLKQNGISLENDPFYLKLNSLARAWIAKDCSTSEFSSRLYTLSLNPKEANDDSTDLKMEAYLKAGCNLDVEERMLRVWKNAYYTERLFRENVDDIIKLRMISYWKAWRSITNRLSNAEEKAEERSRLNLERCSLSLWRKALRDRHKLLDLALNYETRLWFNKWRHVTEQSANTTNEKIQTFALKHHAAPLLERWVLQRRLNKSDMAHNLDLMLLKKYWNGWSKSIRFYHTELDRADNFYRLLQLRKFWNIYQEKAFKPIEKANILNQAARKFIAVKFLMIWINDLRYKKIENVVRETSANCRKQTTFHQWRSAYKLNKKIDDLEHQISHQTLSRCYSLWKKAYHMNMQADQLRRKMLLQKTFNSWFLNLRYLDVLSSGNVICATRSFQSWRLATKLKKYMNSYQRNLVLLCFNNWKRTYEEYAKNNADCAEISRYLLRKPYLIMWKRYANELKMLREKSAQFAVKKDRLESTALKRQMWQRWRHTFSTSKHMYERLVLHEQEALNKASKRRIFVLWRSRNQKYMSLTKTADGFYDNSLQMRYMFKWLSIYDQTLQLDEIYQNRVNIKQLELLKWVISQMSLKMIKYKTDYRNADMFKARWDKNNMNTFFALWMMKYQRREKKKQEKNTEIHLSPAKSTHFDSGSVSDNPYLEGDSTITSFDEYSTKTTALQSSDDLTSQVSSEESPRMNRISPHKMYRTPTRIRKNLSLSSSAKRVRQLNLEQRANYYQQVKYHSPTKTDLRYPETSSSSEGGSPETPTKALARRMELINRQRRK